MSYGYDDEPEDEEPPTTPEPPPDSTPAGTFTATVSREEIAELVADRFFAQMCRRYEDEGSMRETVKETLEKLVREAAEQHVERLTGEAVSAALHDMLQTGWPKTDSYGREAGRVTVKDLALEQLTKTNGYDRKTHATELAERIFTDTFKKELQPLVDEAKTRVRNALNKNVDEAIRTALLEGAGLKAR